jgi:peptidyl-prolyl cis-trans isomerase B (cyclophilin B)
MSQKKVILETSQGIITLELDAEKAPVTVKNFLKYVNDEFYDGTIFHRVIPNFMIQCGGFMPGMVQKATQDPIKNEADNGLPNVPGSIAMARTNDPDSATSQFFINLKDNGFLDHSAPTGQGWGYCVFGKVIDGMDVVTAIASVATGNHSGHGDVPVDTITIEKTTKE